MIKTSIGNNNKQVALFIVLTSGLILGDIINVNTML